MYIHVHMCTLCSILHSIACIYMYAAVKMAGIEKGGGGNGGVDMSPADREKLGKMLVFPTKDVSPKIKKGIKVSFIHTYTMYIYMCHRNGIIHACA